VPSRASSRDRAPGDRQWQCGLLRDSRAPSGACFSRLGRPAWVAEAARPAWLRASPCIHYPAHR
jgi:hypothetical protein